MAAFNYAEMAELCLELITETGRAISVSKLSATPADNSKPWRGAAAATKINTISTIGVFVIPQTSIPTESRGLAFDWVDDELLARVRHVCMVPALGLPNLDEYKIVTDGAVDWNILWGQCLQPGSERLLYVFGVAE